MLYWPSSPLRRGPAPWAAFSLLSCGSLTAAPLPMGQWDFDNPQNLLQATTGIDLQLQGTHAAIAGPWAGNGAVRIGLGSYYICTHGIAPNGSGAYVNRYSILIDFRIASLSSWHCFFQTDSGNGNDGDCFIQPGSGVIGVGQTGYSSTPCQLNVWQRLVVAVDHSLGNYDIYLNGELILNGAPQAVDGRFALDPTFLLFADDDGEDASIDVARVAVYSVCLSPAEAAELGTVATEDPSNHAPTVVAGTAGPAETVTGQSAQFQFAAEDADQDSIQLRIDWGDGSDLSAWSSLVSPGQLVSLGHAVHPARHLPDSSAPLRRAGQARRLDLCPKHIGLRAVAGAVSHATLSAKRQVQWHRDPVGTRYRCGSRSRIRFEYHVRPASYLYPSVFRCRTEVYHCTLTNLQPGSHVPLPRCRRRPNWPGGLLYHGPRGPRRFLIRRLV